RPVIGEMANKVRESIQTNLAEKKEAIELKELEIQLEAEKIDVTLPGRPVRVGGTHILHSIIEEIEDHFIGLGYEVKEGPEVETDYQDSETLNFRKGHTATDMQNSFFITNELLVRTHAAHVQSCTMNALGGKPIRLICPAKVYRRDSDDAIDLHQSTPI